MEDIFANVKLEEIKVGEFRFRFPIRYFDYSLMGAVFPASITRLQRVLPSQKLRPVETTSGMATVVLVAMEVRSIDGMGPYSELHVMIPVTYQTPDNVSGLPGFYYLHLPVTTEEARVGGVEIYGFPKFIADISFEETGEIKRCRVRARERDIITLEVRKSATEFQSYDTYAYTLKNDQLLRTLSQVQGQNSTNYIKGGASFTLGDHPVALQLEALEMDKISVKHRYAPQLKMLQYLPGESLPL